MASLGAVRLKILDLAGGDQPVTNADKTALICFNGEIYNFRELRAELERRGHRFHSQGDTEVVLHAWLEWGNDCFARLHGMFAVALWEETSRRLVLARDRMGIKPLYYYLHGKELHFGSELKALLAHPRVARNLDARGLACYLALNYIPHPHTLLEGVHKLAPGTWMEWRDGRLESQRYWQLQFSPRRRPLTEATEELDLLLDRAVREHLVADVPLGVWLSGGLDSSTITHYATRHFPGKLKTFSVSFRGRSFDETPYFQTVANAYETEHHELDLSPALDLTPAIERIAWHSDEPSADAGALPVFFLSEMTRRHVTVALSGEGADELFGGYATYLADRYATRARLAPAAFRRAALKVAQLIPVSDDKVSVEYKLKRFLEGTFLEPVAAHLFWNGACSREQVARLLNVDEPFTPASLVGQLPHDNGINRYLYLDQQLYLVEDILNKCDRMSMAHSLEVRPPFLDHRIVEFAASLPEEMKVRGTRLKFVLRELMRDKLPQAVLTRSKQGFDIPTHHWFRTSLKSFLLDTVTEQAARDTGLLNWAAIQAMMQDHFARRANLGYPLWGLLIFFLWYRRLRGASAPAF
jgi:asparagine synthase (glutamine-hydrolysing)